MRHALRLTLLATMLATHAGADSGDDPLGGVKRLRRVDDICPVCRAPDGGTYDASDGCGHHAPRDWPPPMPTNADIVAVVAGHKEQIKACVVLRSKPGESGTVSMHWELKQTGATGAIRCNTEPFRDSAMAKCLAAEIATWKFPVFVGEPYPVDFPFKF